MITLNEEQIEALKVTLQGQRRSVILAIRLHLHQSEQPEERALASRCDEDDGPTAELMAEMGIAQLRHEFDELKEIDFALQRISAGDYGQCVQCGSSIPHERMFAQPVAKTCLSCQTLLEQRHGGWPSN